MWLYLLFFLLRNYAAPIDLPSLSIDKKQISISGLSSGAYMAVQMGVAYSSVFSGVGSVGGGVYWCAEGSAQIAQSTCMSTPEWQQVEKQLLKTKHLATQKKIDSLQNLSQQKFYIFAGQLDQTVKPENSDNLVEYYLQLGVAPTKIHYENTILAEHGFPTDGMGNSCEEARSPWILNCNYDGAGLMLETFYGKLKRKVAFKENNLKAFKQTPFGNFITPLYDYGWIYVPTACESKAANCKLHIALHGCKMTPSYIKDEFVRMSGFNEWAEANQIIVLYPQSQNLAPLNSNGCWDWYGYTGSNYAEKNGNQMRALKKMVDHLVR